MERDSRRAVSPELALVDPELARAERARLEERATLAAYNAAAAVGAGAHAVRSGAPTAARDEARRRPRRRRTSRTRRLLVVLACAALVVGGVIAAVVLFRSPHSTAPQHAALVMPRLTLAPSTAPVHVNHDRLPTAGVLERRLLVLLATAPSAKLPHQLLDARTRSLRTDARATCRRTGGRSYACVVRSSRRPANEGLYVTYRLRSTGGGVFAWHGYRKR